MTPPATPYTTLDEFEAHLRHLRASDRDGVQEPQFVERLIATVRLALTPAAPATLGELRTLVRDVNEARTTPAQYHADAALDAALVALCAEGEGTRDAAYLLAMDYLQSDRYLDGPEGIRTATDTIINARSLARPAGADATTSDDFDDVGLFEALRRGGSGEWPPRPKPVLVTDSPASPPPDADASAEALLAEGRRLANAAIKAQRDFSEIRITATERSAVERADVDCQRTAAAPPRTTGEDTERLNWLEKRAWFTMDGGGPESPYAVTLHFDENGSRRFDSQFAVSVRAAIDTARASEATGEAPETSPTRSGQPDASPTPSTEQK